MKLFFTTILYLITILFSCLAKSSPLPPLHTNHQWVLNDKGQVVIFRGVNLVVKSGQSPLAAGFDGKSAELLHQHGFNLIRLGVLWHSIEPTPTQFNETYINDIRDTVKLLSEHGIYTLIDFHQDQYSQKYGDGFPNWATVDKGTHVPDIGFPCNLFGIDDFVYQNKHYQVRTDIDHAYSAFWQNARVPEHPHETLQSAYTRMILHIVTRLRDEQRNLIGYDLMNEPFVGLAWRSCIKANFNLHDPSAIKKNLKLGCPQFDATLTTFYQKLVNAIRSVDQNAIVWYETNLLYGLGATNYLGAVTGKNIGLSFHDYDSENVSWPIQQALDYQKKMSVPLLMGEFGATTDLSLLKKFVTANNNAMISTIYWAYANDAAYRFCQVGKYLPPDPRSQGIVLDLKKQLSAPNLNVAMLNVLTGAYPQAISGTPLAFSYDSSKKVFFLRYNPINPLGEQIKAPTQIYIPLMQYPHGYNVKVANAVVVSPHNSEYLLVTSKDKHRDVTVEVSPFLGSGLT